MCVRRLSRQPRPKRQLPAPTAAQPPRRMPAVAANTAAARSAAEPEGAKAPAWLSYDFSIKWLTPFYPANPSQAAGGGEKCMDLRFFAATPLAAEPAAE